MHLLLETVFSKVEARIYNTKYSYMVVKRVGIYLFKVNKGNTQCVKYVES